MWFQVRTARPEISVQGKDYYSELAPYFLDMTYTDNCDGEKADDLHIQLADRDNKFISSWMPDVGTTIEAAVICERWFAPFGSALKLDCGLFWIDSVEFELPQHTVSIKAQSIPVGQPLKQSNEDRGWENSSLKDITAQVATENQMQPDYQAQNNPRYKRVEQADESALQFIKKRADAAKLAVKVHRGKIVIYDEQELESRPPAFTLVYGTGMSGSAPLGGALGALGNIGSGGIGAGGGAVYRMTGGHFTINVNDTTKQTTVSYVNPETGRRTQETFQVQDGGSPSRGGFLNQPGGVTGGGGGAPAGDGSQEIPSLPTQVITPDETHNYVNENPAYAPDQGGGGGGQRRRKMALASGGNGEEVADWEDNEPSDNWGKGSGGDSSAALLAKAKTRKKNKHHFQAKIQLSIGNPLVAAGQVFVLVGCGQFDGNWYIESAEHKVGPIYTTELACHMCLQGY